MKTKSTLAVTALITASMLAGCAADGTLLQTGSIADDTTTAAVAKPRVDPVCVALVAKIDGLRQEGTPSRLEKVATGKSATANVKREALARMTELDQANAEFQAKCSKLGTLAAARPAAPAAATTPAAAAPTNAAAAAAAAATPVAKATTAAASAADTADQITAAANAAEAAKTSGKAAASAVSAAAQ